MLNRNNRSRATRRSSHHLRLHLEDLESRHMLAVFTVTSPFDVVDPNDGVLTLREAIDSANSLPGQDTVNFSPLIAGFTVTLALGELTIADDMILQGLGSADTTIDANGLSRVLRVIDGDNATARDVEVRDVTLTGGYVNGSNGAGIYSRENMVIADSTITGNTVVGVSGGGVPRRGGGIFAGGGGVATMTIQDSTVSNNEAPTGGGIAISATTSISGGVIQFNTATYQGGGVLQLSATRTTTISGTDIWANSAETGGGIATLESTNAYNVSITNSTVNGNIADKCAGTYNVSHISNAEIRGNRAYVGVGGGICAYAGTVLDALKIYSNYTYGSLAFGGGIFAPNDLVISGSIVKDNSTYGPGSPGAGIAAFGNVDVVNTTFFGNEAMGIGSDGGGIFANGNVTLTDSEFQFSSAFGRYARGGGVFSNGDVTLNATVVAGGFTSGDYGKGAAIYAGGTTTLHDSTIMASQTRGNFSSGGAIFSNGDVLIRNSTLSGNKTAGDDSPGGAIATSGTLAITNSTLSGNYTEGPQSNGGAVSLLPGGSLDVRISTIVHNRVENAASSGGGIYVSDNNPSTIRNSILATNTATVNPDLRFGGTSSPSLQYSLIGNNAGTSLAEAPVGSPDAYGNLIGGSTYGLIDPMLFPLADNGGPTSTHALAPLASPAIDAGDPNAVAGIGGTPEFDQRGAPFGRVKFGGSGPNPRIDMGAFENDVTGLVVDILVDEADQNYSPGDLSLREAINIADNAPGYDRITFDPSLSGQTIELSGNRLFVDDTVGIDASELVQPITIDANGQSGIIRVNEYAGEVTITGLRMTGGNSSSGGAISSSSGPIVLEDVEIFDNHSTGAGGAINGFTVVLTNSSITNNFARFGGAISAGQITLVDSTLSGNIAEERGGAIRARDDVLIMNSTVSGNHVMDGNAGGIYTQSNPNNPELRVYNSTITENSASTNGGVEAGGPFAMVNSILAGNTAQVSNPDLAYHQNAVIRYSLIGDNSGTALPEAPVGAPDVNGNLVGGPMFGTIDPVLGPLADNGGSTMTQRPLTGSPVTDAGDPNFSGTAYDQRGAPFIRVSDGDFNGSLRIDMGAVESRPLRVDTTSDIVDGNYSAGNLALREALTLSNTLPQPETITFDSSLNGQTINLSGTQLEATQPVKLDASDLAMPVTIDAQGLSRVLHIASSAGDFHLRGLTLTGGYLVDAPGGGILSDATGELLLEDVSIIGNVVVEDEGGGVFANGPVTISGTSISYNTAAGTGGGIATRRAAPVQISHSIVNGNVVEFDPGADPPDGSGGGLAVLFANLTITNSTIDGNLAARDGAGIYTRSGNITLNSSTVSNNADLDTSQFSSGIWSYEGDVTLWNSTLSGNSRWGIVVDEGNLAIAHSTITENGVGVFSRDSTQLVVDHSVVAANTDDDLVTVNSVPLQYYSFVGGNPVLGPLQDNGGPTYTHRPLQNSPVIDAGDPNAQPGVDGVPFDDQRGFPYARVRDGDDDQIVRIDIGAVEIQDAAFNIDGDFNNDGAFDCLDVDALTAEIATMSNRPGFDLNEDGVVDIVDLDQWLIDAGAENVMQTGGNPYLRGDANLDGVVDAIDFIIWNTNKFTLNTAWCSGNFNADAVVDATDFILWNVRKFTSTDAPAPTPFGVNEPESPSVLTFMMNTQANATTFVLPMGTNRHVHQADALFAVRKPADQADAAREDSLLELRKELPG